MAGYGRRSSIYTHIYKCPSEIDSVISYFAVCCLSSLNETINFSRYFLNIKILRYCSTYIMSIYNTNPIYEFSLGKIKEGASVLIIGKRGSGKSCLIRHIINNKSWNSETTAVSPSCRLNPFHNIYIPIVHHFIPHTLLADMKVQTDQHRVIVLDDCIMSTSTCKQLFNNRQSNTTLIIAQQEPYGLSSEIRKNFDYVFAFNDGSGASAKRIMEHYAKGFDTLTIFRKAFDCITENNKVMAIDVCMRDRNVFWYRFIPQYTDSDDEPESTNSIDSDDEPEAVNSIDSDELEAVSESDTVSMPEDTVEETNAGHTCTLL